MFGNPDTTLALVHEILLDNTPESFQSYLDEVLERILSSSGKTVYIIGDFNISLLNVETLFTKHYLLSLQSNSFFAKIDKSTRVYHNSATFIRNIFANNVCRKITNGNIFADIDHYSQFWIVESSDQKPDYSQKGYDARFLSILERRLQH